MTDDMKEVDKVANMVADIIMARLPRVKTFHFECRRFFSSE